MYDMVLGIDISGILISAQFLPSSFYPNKFLGDCVIGAFDSFVPYLTTIRAKAFLFQKELDLPVDKH